MGEFVKVCLFICCCFIFYFGFGFRCCCRLFVYLLLLVFVCLGLLAAMDVRSHFLMMTAETELVQDQSK